MITNDSIKIKSFLRLCENNFLFYVFMLGKILKMLDDIQLFNFHVNNKIFEGAVKKSSKLPCAGPEI